MTQSICNVGFECANENEINGTIGDMEKEKLDCE